MGAQVRFHFCLNLRTGLLERFFVPCLHLAPRVHRASEGDVGNRHVQVPSPDVHYLRPQVLCQRSEGVCGGLQNEGQLVVEAAQAEGVLEAAALVLALKTLGTGFERR